jgi:peptidoglycan/LPS O-acetylase OafA/YrhL
VIGKPRLTIAVVLLVLAALAATMTYSGVLVIGVLADYLGTSRFVAGLLLGVLFARFPWIRRGKPRIVGLLPKPVRLPLMTGLLALCLLHFLTEGDAVAAVFVGMTIVFLLGFPWLKKRLFARLSSSVFNFGAGRNAPVVADSTVIDGEFRERKD